ncbi:MAG TPA: dihydrofolate reductase family protein [Thermoplasmata archaeon]|nr:dihydrofolate reductase family protein [Thermoplasmata archaeon]
MTRRITANLYMTLDGRGEFPKYPGSDLPSGNPDEPDEFFQKMWTDRYSDVTTVVMGRRSFVGHRRVHSLRARKPDAPKFMFDYSRFLERVDKVCLSHRLKKLDWGNSRVMKGDLAKILAKLKSEKGGNIIIEGGPRLIYEVLRLNLADDYWFLIMPVVFGRGPRYWYPMKTQTNLKLQSASHMKYGELVLHYEADRKSTESRSQ